MLNPRTRPDKTIIEGQPIFVRINGTLPDISTLGSEEKSERGSGDKTTRYKYKTLLAQYMLKIERDRKMFHLLVDIGQGIIKSIEQGASELALSTFIPNALLITHSHDDHIKEIPMLVNKVNENIESRAENLMIFCTMECRDQIIKKFPQLSEKTGNNNRVSFNVVQPDETFQVGPFSVMAILADHGDNSPPGSVIYIVKLLDKKIIVGWDFISLPDANQNLFWKPDLLILGYSKLQSSS